MDKKVDQKNPRKGPHLCLTTNPSNSSNKGKLNTKDIKIGARKAKALTTFVNSSAHPKIKVCPNWHEGGIT
jgi:hypothetical protein